VLVMISNMSVPICNRFHTDEPITSKLRFYGDSLPLFDALVGKELPYTGARSFVTKKPRVFGAAHSEDFVILACTVLIKYSSVTDRQTDGRT